MNISIPISSIPSHIQLHQGEFEAGFLHPVLGFDHLLAMIAVGMISTMFNKNAIFAFNKINLLNNEIGISLSVIILGLLIFSRSNFSIFIAISFVVFFGFFHGHAYGLEMPKLAGITKYIFGFMTASVLLHILGILITKFYIKIYKTPKALSISGAFISCVGVFFLIN